jgi:hypothetical protein
MEVMLFNPGSSAVAAVLGLLGVMGLLGVPV